MELREKYVLEAKRYGIITCNGHDAMLQAARIMIEEDISCLIVTDLEGNLDGVITRTDLLRAFCTDRDWDRKKVNEYMTFDMIMEKPTDVIGDVAKLLLDQKIHRVVVIQEDLEKIRPITVISETDLIYHMVKDEIDQ